MFSLNDGSLVSSPPKKSKSVFSISIRAFCRTISPFAVKRIVFALVPVWCSCKCPPFYQGLVPLPDKGLYVNSHYKAIKLCLTESCRTVPRTDTFVSRYYISE